ncbi:unnamed protein product, partial [Iphiclides podalirius]
MPTVAECGATARRCPIKKRQVITIALEKTAIKGRIKRRAGRSVPQALRFTRICRETPASAAHLRTSDRSVAQNIASKN